MLRTLISPWVTASSASSASFTSSPSSATNGSGSGTYDGNGQRVEKVSGGTTIVTIFAGSQVLAEYYNNAQPSSPTNEYIYAGSLMIASIQSGTTDYWHNDHLSPRVRTDTSGSVADQRGTFPFGETWYSPGSSPYMFTSYYRDYEAAGNDYAQARTYVGGLGRFSSPDPVSGSTSDPQSLNRYSYVRNMPVMLTDPFGLTPSCNTAKNPDTSQPQDSNSGGGPSATDSGDPSEAEPQSASQNPCDQDPWYYGGGSGLVSIDSGEGFDPGDGGSGLTGIGSDPFSILDAAFTPTSYQTIDNPDCGPALDCPTGTPPEITVPVYGNLGLLSLLGGPGGNTSAPNNGCGVSASSLDNYLSSKNSPMAGQGANLMASGAQYNIDPRLFVSLAGAETTFGLHVTAGQFNVFNVLYHGLNSPFSSYQSAINSVGHSLTNPRNGYDFTNTATLYGHYCSGAGCAAGLKNLNTFMNQQGANTSALHYPCKKE